MFIARGDEVMLKPDIGHEYRDRVFVVESIDWRYRGRNQPKPYLCRLKGGALRLRFKTADLMPRSEGELVRSLKGIH